MAATKPVRSTKSIHHAAKEWARKNPDEIARYRGRFIVVGALGVQMDDSSEENLRNRCKALGWLNPFLFQVPGSIGGNP